MSARLFLALLVTAVVASLAAGFLVVGGPAQARRDKLDYQRYLALNKISRVLICPVGTGSPKETLPGALTLDSLHAHCPAIGLATSDLVDAARGAEFVYHRLSDRNFSVCATFHDAARVARLHREVALSATFDPATGCMSGSMR